MMSSLRDYRKNTKHQRTNEKHSDTYKYQCVFRPCCRLAPTRKVGNRPAVGCPPYVDARRSVAHLTITNVFHAPSSSVASYRR
ncbi:MAG: hypothetical protein LBQ66_12420 [Planctomycetaceae bacterium]|nr:hypothetical protein [Planctomycetaceae bacterium]